MPLRENRGDGMTQYFYSAPQRVMVLTRFSVLLVLCANVLQVNAADTDLEDAMSKAQRRGVPIFVYVYDSI
jgi:hypothetical protein